MSKFNYIAISNSNVFRGKRKFAIVFTYNQLISYNIHLGGLVSEIFGTSFGFLFAKKDNFVFLNLLPTLLILRRVLRIVESVVFARRKLLFVNNDLKMATVVYNAAEECAEPYSVSIGVGGTLTNFKLLWIFFNQFLRHASWKDLTRPRARLRFSLQGLSLLMGPPGLIFINSLKGSANAANEAHAVFIPVVGLVDIDSNSGDSLYMIPANDESLLSVGFFNSIFAKLSLSCKFKMARKFLQRKFLREQKETVNTLNKYALNIIMFKKGAETQIFKGVRLPAEQWYMLRKLRKVRGEIRNANAVTFKFKHVYLKWWLKKLPKLRSFFSVLNYERKKSKREVKQLLFEFFYKYNRQGFVKDRFEGLFKDDRRAYKYFWKSAKQFQRIKIDSPTAVTLRKTMGLGSFKLAKEFKWNYTFAEKFNKLMLFNRPSYKNLYACLVRLGGSQSFRTERSANGLHLASKFVRKEFSRGVSKEPTARVIFILVDLLSKLGIDKQILIVYLQKIFSKKLLRLQGKKSEEAFKEKLILNNNFFCNVPSNLFYKKRFLFIYNSANIQNNLFSFDKLTITQMKNYFLKSLRLRNLGFLNNLLINTKIPAVKLHVSWFKRFFYDHFFLFLKKGASLPRLTEAFFLSLLRNLRKLNYSQEIIKQFFRFFKRLVTLKHKMVGLRNSVFWFVSEGRHKRFYVERRSKVGLKGKYIAKGRSGLETFYFSRSMIFSKFYLSFNQRGLDRFGDKSLQPWVEPSNWVFYKTAQNLQRCVILKYLNAGFRGFDLDDFSLIKKKARKSRKTRIFINKSTSLYKYYTRRKMEALFRYLVIRHDRHFPKVPFKKARERFFAFKRFLYGNLSGSKDKNRTFNKGNFPFGSKKKRSHFSKFNNDKMTFKFTKKKKPLVSKEQQQCVGSGNLLAMDAFLKKSKNKNKFRNRKGNVSVMINPDLTLDENLGKVLLEQKKHLNKPVKITYPTPEQIFSNHHLELTTDGIIRGRSKTYQINKSKALAELETLSFLRKHFSNVTMNFIY